jgi:ornithine cyclodeaminase/alanine dehydrogenase-like protein (mu-crystallin family)
MLLLNGAEVEQAAPMAALVHAIEAGYHEEADGQVVLPPRLNMPNGPSGFFRVMPAVLNRSGLMGYKVFHGSMREGIRYLIAVYDQHSGILLALMDAHYLTAARTGATTGVATKFMARSDIETIGVIGSGLEARTNLLGVAAVRKFKRIKVYSTNPQRRERFAHVMADQLGIEAAATDTPQACVKDVDLVIVATNSTGRAEQIAYRGAWIQPGVHVSAIGSTMPRLREIDPDTFANANIIVGDSLVQMEEESGDVIAAVAENKYPRERLFELKEIVAGRASGRRDDTSVTLFKSVGTAIQDVLAGHVVYKEALERGLGREVDDILDPKFF